MDLTMMWNPELVAALEAERVKGLPRRTLETNRTEPPLEILKRRQIAMEMAYYTRKKA